ncbi:methyl-accepting chemotaxis protein [Paenibacillus xanthanilyticus]
MKIGQKLALLVIISLVGLFSISGVGIYQLLDSQEKLDSMYKDKLLSISNLQTINTNEQAVKAKLLELMLATDTSKNETLKTEIDDITKENGGFRQQYTTDDAVEMKKLEELDSKTQQYLSARDAVIQLALANKNEEAYQLFNEQVVSGLTSMENVITELVTLNSESAAAVSQSNAEHSDRMMAVIIAVIIANAAVALIMGRLIMLSVTKPVRELESLMNQAASGELTVVGTYSSRDELGSLTNSFNNMVSGLRELIGTVSETSRKVAESSEELSMSADQSSQATEHISHTIQELAYGAEQQVQSVKNSSDTIQEMSSRTKHISSAASMVKGTAHTAAVQSDQGAYAITNAIEQMNAIHTRVSSLSQAVTDLGERSKQIELISKSISDISGQTNLLALNAAIEAARAGEHGRGFAVVADEVRQLAEESSGSAKQISELINQIQRETQTVVDAMSDTMHEVSSGIDVVNGAGSAFRQIQDAIQIVTSQITEVTAAVEELSHGTGEVAHSITDVNKIAEDTAAGTQHVSAATQQQLASMEEINMSASRLAGMAEELKQIVDRFKY